MSFTKKQETNLRRIIPNAANYKVWFNWTTPTGPNPSKKTLLFSLLRINADNQDKKFLCIFWSIFLVFVIALAIISKLRNDILMKYLLQ